MVHWHKEKSDGQRKHDHKGCVRTLLRIREHHAQTHEGAMHCKARQVSNVLRSLTCHQPNNLHQATDSNGAYSGQGSVAIADGTVAFCVCQSFPGMQEARGQSSCKQATGSRQVQELSGLPQPPTTVCNPEPPLSLPWRCISPLQKKPHPLAFLAFRKRQLPKSRS